MKNRHGADDLFLFNAGKLFLDFFDNSDNTSSKYALALALIQYEWDDIATSLMRGSARGEGAAPILSINSLDQDILFIIIVN